MSNPLNQRRGLLGFLFGQNHKTLSSWHTVFDRFGSICNIYKWPPNTLFLENISRFFWNLIIQFYWSFGLSPKNQKKKKNFLFKNLFYRRCTSPDVSFTVLKQMKEREKKIETRLKDDKMKNGWLKSWFPNMNKFWILIGKDTKICFKFYWNQPRKKKCHTNQTLGLFNDVEEFFVFHECRSRPPKHVYLVLFVWWLSFFNHPESKVGVFDWLNKLAL